MTIRVGALNYEWQADWARIPATTGWAHHGLTVGPDGNIVTADSVEPIIRVLSPDGELLQEFSTPVTENHGICVAEGDGEPALWIADTGNKVFGESYGPARVIKVDMTGKVLAEITAADCGVGSRETFCPTAVTVDPANGNVWVTDGYGTGRIYCFSGELVLLRTIAGSGELQSKRTGASRDIHLHIHTSAREYFDILRRLESCCSRNRGRNGLKLNRSHVHISIKNTYRGHKI